MIRITKFSLLITYNELKDNDIKYELHFYIRDVIFKIS